MLKGSKLCAVFICLCTFHTLTNAAPTLNAGAYEYLGTHWNTVTYENLEWLELNATKGQSFNNVNSQIDSGVFSGWRYASVNELDNLLLEGYEIPHEVDTCRFGSLYCDNSSILTYDIESATGSFQLGRYNVSEFIDDFGATQVITSSLSGTVQQTTTGMTGDVFHYDNQGLPITARIYHRSRPGDLHEHNSVHIDSTRLPDGNYATVGSFLVRELGPTSPLEPTLVAEPDSLFLLGLGLIGLYCSRKKRAIL